MITKNIKYFQFAIIIGILALSLLNTAELSSADSYLDKKAIIISEEYGPANISITMLTVENCDDCFKIDGFLKSLTESNVRVLSEKSYDVYSQEGKKLINEYKIDKAPTFILQGNVNNKNLKAMLNDNGKFIGNNTFVYTKITPVFLDMKSDKFIGRVNATLIIDQSCSECINMSLVISNINKSGVSIKSIDIFNLSDAKGKDLIEKYSISIVPTMILSNDILDYESIQQALLEIGTIEKDQSFVFRAISPPYRNLSSNQVIGKVEMINIVDKYCDTCYNVSINKEIMQNGYGVFVSSDVTYDINSSKGVGLLSKYNITKVPTFLLSSQAVYYVNLMQIWNSVGTVENDGWLVFRNIGAIKDAVYKDLSKNQVVEK